MTTDLAIASHTFRRLWRGALAWGVVFGVTAAASALTYAQTYPTQAERRQLAAGTGADAGLAVLLGPVSDVGTVGGYLVYKDFVFLTTIGAVWALLASTRLLRGEEETGRWQIQLAGATRAGRTTAVTLLALGAATGLLCGAAAVVIALAGRNPDVHFGIGASLFYGLSLAIAPAFFGAAGALTSQLVSSRRAATSLGLVLFAAMSLLRMVADSGPRVAWLRWLTPFGWTELIAPFTQNNVRPLVPAAACVVGLAAGAVFLAARRDAGEGLVADRSSRASKPLRIGSPLGLSIRLERGALLAWCVGAAGAGLALGIIAETVAGPVPDSFGAALAKFDASGTLVDQYFSVAFLLIATLVALIPASQLAAAAQEETSGRLVHLLAGPVGPIRFLGGRLALSAAAVLAAGLLAGTAAWCGAASRGVDAGFGGLLATGISITPVALIALGIGAVIFGVAPRAAGSSVYAVVAGSLVIDLLGSLLTQAHGIERLSLFHYLPADPSHRVDFARLAGTTAVGAALCVLAMVLFARRDQATG